MIRILILIVEIIVVRRIAVIVYSFIRITFF